MIEKPLDLRSDTLSQPTPAMRRFMAEAPVGDCFYEEDPTVRLLEETVAHLFSHEAAMFVPSGTMSNQIAIQLHCGRGEAVLCPADLHILRAESGATAALAGVQPVAVPVQQEFLPDIEKLDELFVPMSSIVCPPTRLLVAENTHLFSGGRIHPIEHLRQLANWCKTNQVAFHLDGARIWHAHVETQIPLHEFGHLFHTVSVCFSKGLGAPVGSCLIGPHALIQRGKTLRKRMGGTMRQCGILAAGALFAIENHMNQLRDDHAKAKSLADWLRKQYPEAEVPVPETNIVLMKFKTNALHILDELEKKNGLRLSALGSRILRAVCYRDIPAGDLERVLKS